ncbi:hypothetical protein GGD54_005808 [Rhizobium tropici]|uniref:Uncharacterized protein n=2 Tax=Rhizobium TaxID=379 RepID=A0A1C3X8X4_9HYPH|nr:hypothetical protein [Rhizobium tropici]MBB5596309.1 hypothetical protein [Rhizobium tropici]MBB6489092.1 hypothetical protein [Rhizobium lusitanum]MBB6495359.1 hypothetical protein [Rhizobium tropici]SCB48655.1 hypothetical protein GA0061101_12852 [Rhizobium lusitanum]
MIWGRPPKTSLRHFHAVAVIVAGKRFVAGAPGKALGTNNDCLVCRLADILRWPICICTLITLLRNSRRVVPTLFIARLA